MSTRFMRAIFGFCLLGIAFGVGLTPYDYYTFEASWAGTICKLKRCSGYTGSDQTFNIHGLWPDAANGNHPFYCSTDKLDFNQLSSHLKSDLREHWSGLYNSQEGFLKHEWDKHGTCWNPSYGNPSKIDSTIAPLLRSNKPTPDSYMALVVSLSKKYNSYEFLKSAGVIPSSTKSYSNDQVLSALTRGFGVRALTINCSKDENGRDMLEDVRICVDKDYKPFNCPKGARNNCSRDIWYFPKPSRLSLTKRLFEE